jgi:hypothetical protein
MPKAPTGLVGASANRECNTKEDRGDGPIRLSDAGHMADTEGGYAWRYRIPQLYPPSRMQIPAQIQGASRSSGEPNQPRLRPRAPLGLNPPSFHLSTGFTFQRFSFPPQIAPHHHGFQSDGCRRFMRGTVEMEQILSGCACNPGHGIRGEDRAR